jgi:hypothetical protein
MCVSSHPWSDAQQDALLSDDIGRRQISFHSVGGTVVGFKRSLHGIGPSLDVLVIR